MNPKRNNALDAIGVGKSSGGKTVSIPADGTRTTVASITVESDGIYLVTANVYTNENTLDNRKVDQAYIYINDDEKNSDWVLLSKQFAAVYWIGKGDIISVKCRAWQKCNVEGGMHILRLK